MHANPPPALAEPCAYPDLDLDEASAAVDAIALSAEYPLRLFELLRDILCISAGAFLFLDEAAGVYAPLALAGLDQTSGHRLRLPAGALSAFCPDGPVLLKGEDLKAFKMFFSHRSFRRLRSLRLIPLAFQVGPVASPRTALLLAADEGITPPARPVPEGWHAITGFLGERLSAWASRFGKSLSQGENEAWREKLLEALAESARRGLKAIFIVLPLEEALRAMEEANPQADRYRLYAEIQAFIAGMLAPPSMALPLKRNRLGLLVVRSSAPDAELFLHQMHSPLLRVFPSLAGWVLAAEALIDPLGEPEALQALIGAAPATLPA